MNDLITYLLTPSVQVLLIIGLVEVVKRLEVMPKKLLPVLDVILGMISGVCVYGLHLGYGMTNGILIGIALGLSACGLFSGVKNLSETNV